MAKDTVGSSEPLVINIHLETAAYEPPTVQPQKKIGGSPTPQDGAGCAQLVSADGQPRTGLPHIRSRAGRMPERGLSELARDGRRRCNAR